MVIMVVLAFALGNYLTADFFTSMEIRKNGRVGLLHPIWKFASGMAVGIVIIGMLWSKW
jgi:hypothetical protein